MASLIFYTFACIGACFIIKYSAILNAPRNWLKQFDFFGELLNCCLCLGWWVGAWMSYDQPFQLQLMFSFYSAGTCWIADHLMMLLQKKVYK